MSTPLLQCVKNGMLLRDVYGRKRLRRQKFIVERSFTMAPVFSPKKRVRVGWGGDLFRNGRRDEQRPGRPRRASVDGNAADVEELIRSVGRNCC